MSNVNLIKELRERTNSGFVDCKKALEASNWEIEAAIEWLKENGISKAAKKAGRIAAEGLVTIAGDNKKAILVELNSETDFVSKNETFKTLLTSIAEALVKSDAKNDEEALKVKLQNGQTIEDACSSATATIGEKISFRRSLKVVAQTNQTLGLYVHANGQIASIIVLETTEQNSENVAKNIAMHMAAMNPEFTLVSDIPTEKLESIKAGFVEPNLFELKPQNIKDKIISGWLDKQLSEIVLEKQPLVMDDSFSVEKYLKNNKSKLVKAFRFEVGEGIEKVQSNFAEEVMSFVRK